MTRAELLAALAAATGPDRALDVEIFRVVQNLPRAEYELASGWQNIIPRYTASVDAALTLVPEGASWSVFGVGIACVQPAGAMSSNVLTAKTPALALCIAALSASAP